MHIVWFLGNIHKASFILWLAVKEKLGTHDRLQNLPSGTRCLLCNSQMESHDHLFFGCQYTQQTWSQISRKGDFITPHIPWRNLVSWLSQNWKGKSLRENSFKLCLSVIIYHLWRERNRRFHTHTPWMFRKSHLLLRRKFAKALYF